MRSPHFHRLILERVRNKFGTSADTRSKYGYTVDNKYVTLTTALTGSSKAPATLLTYFNQRVPGHPGKPIDGTEEVVGNFSCNTTLKPSFRTANTKVAPQT